MILCKTLPNLIGFIRRNVQNSTIITCLNNHQYYYLSTKAAATSNEAVNEEKAQGEKYFQILLL